MADTKTPDGRPDAFADFLKEAENFTAALLDGIAKAVGAHDDAPLIASHGGALREQMGRLAQVTRDRYAAADAQSRRTVDEFLNVQSVTTMARNAQTTLKASVAKGLFGGGIFNWLESNLEEIKKIFEAIWGLFGHVPEWLSKVLQIIDEILKMVLGLFGGVLGHSSSKIMSELSTMEVEFWNELAAHKRYRLAAAGAAASAED